MHARRRPCAASNGKGEGGKRQKWAKTWIFRHMNIALTPCEPVHQGPACGGRCRGFVPTIVRSDEDLGQASPLRVTEFQFI